MSDTIDVGLGKGAMKRKVITEGKYPKTAKPQDISMRTGLIIFFGTIFALAAAFTIYTIAEDYSKYPVTSHAATYRELEAMKTDSVPVGDWVSLNIPDYPPAMAAVLEKDGKYELKVLSFGHGWWIPDVKYELNLQTADGTIVQMDRSLVKTIKGSLDQKKDVLPVTKLERWNIKFN